MESQRKCCVYCGCELDGCESKEHIIQNALGGHLISENICCNECNALVSKYIDGPFTRYFSPIINSLERFAKDNNTKANPAYDVVVEYEGKHYDGKAKDGELIYCKDLSNKLHKRVSDICPAPKIIYIKMQMEDEEFKNGLRKIAFNFALSKGVPLVLIQSGLIVNRNRGKINDIAFNYPIIPFIPLNPVDEFVELYTEVELFHALILFADGPNLWCYIDLFNTYQFYVLLACSWPEDDSFYQSYCQYVQKQEKEERIRQLDSIGVRRMQDVPVLAQEFGIPIDKNSFDLQSFMEQLKEKIEAIKKEIRKEPLEISLCDLEERKIQSPGLDDFMSNGQSIWAIGKPRQIVGTLKSRCLYFDDDGNAINGTFRSLTLDGLSCKLHCYPELIYQKLNAGYVPDEYTYRKARRLLQFLKMEKLLRKDL